MTELATDTGPLVTNLITYFKANQTAKLTEVNGGPGLADIAYHYETGFGAGDNIYPNVQFLDERDNTKYEDSGNVITYTVDLQIEVFALASVEGTFDDALARLQRARAKKYIRAHESMLLNIPATSLMAGLLANYTRPHIIEMSKLLGPLRGDDAIMGYAPKMRIAWEFLER